MPPEHDAAMTSFLLRAIDASLQAGKAVLAVYETDFRVAHKADDSPLTRADKESHRVLKTVLEPTRLPVLSEEGRHLPYEQRRRWVRFWLLDPLDGTKEFVKRNDEFTVNVALVDHGRPVMGVVYAPVYDALYFSVPGGGAYKLAPARSAWPTVVDGNRGTAGQIEALLRLSQRLPIAAAAPEVFTIVGSRSHGTPELEDIVREMRTEHGEVAFISAGSSLKLCLVAEGRAHLYPRTGPTMEWDTAAGQAVAEAAGGEVVEYETGTPLRYNKEALRNPWFVVRRSAKLKAERNDIL